MTVPVSDREVIVDQPRKRHSLLRIVLSLLVLAVLIVVAVVVAVSATSSQSAKKDVTITQCRAAANGGKPTASGTILNHSSKTSNYVVRLSFNDAQGNRVSEGVAPVANVAADETATFDVTGARDAQGPVQCEIADVSRTHIPGQ